MEQRQYAHGDHHIVRQGDNHPGSQTPFEAEADVDQDTDQRGNQRQGASLREVRADARADKLNSLHRRILAGRFVNHRHDLAAQFLADVGVMHRRHTYHDVAAAAKVLHLRLFKARFLQGVAHLVQIDRLLKGNLDHRTAGEIEPPVKAADADDGDRHNQQKT